MQSFQKYKEGKNDRAKSKQGANLHSCRVRAKHQWHECFYSMRLKKKAKKEISTMWDMKSKRIPLASSMASQEIKSIHGRTA